MAAFSPSPAPLASSSDRYCYCLLSLSFAALPSPPPRRPFVGDLGIRKNLHGFEARRPQPPGPHLRSSVPSLFSLSTSAPSSLIDAAIVASFTTACPPPTKTSCRRRLPSSSTDVITASLFLHCCPASPRATQEEPHPPAPPPLLIFTFVRCHHRGLEPKMVVEDVVSLNLFSFWAGNALKLYLVGWVGPAYCAKYGLGWPVG